ncbi:hypothetical protein F-LCD7_0506 [Faustovirus]|nr:hypothetical protein F-LCD7_0506 [Faustovirus]QJX73259.1 hypothetical protein F-VV57_0498 [Faustovirus]QJX73766.1 hypothetical protein F-VV63_0500 [Faustovirus]
MRLGCAPPLWNMLGPMGGAAGVTRHDYNTRHIDSPPHRRVGGRNGVIGLGESIGAEKGPGSIL